MFPSSLIQPQRTMRQNNSTGTQNQPRCPPHPTRRQGRMHPYKLNGNLQTPTPPLPPPPFINANPYVMQQQFSGWHTHTTPGNFPMQHYYSYHPNPVYQGGPGVQQHQHQYRPGPSHNQQIKRHKTEAQYPNTLLHVSSGTISKDQSTGIHPRMGAFKNTGNGGGWKPPSEDPVIVDHNSTYQVQVYERDRAAHSWRRKKRSEGPTAYEIPITGSESKLI